MLRQHAREFQQEAGAGTAVVRTNKVDLLEPLRVVMRTEKDALFAAPLRVGDDVAELLRSHRRLVVEDLKLDVESVGIQFGFDVLFRLRASRRAGNAGTDGDKRFH